MTHKGPPPETTGLQHERGAVLQVTAAAVMISFSAVFVKLVHVSPVSSGFYRVFFGGLILTALVLIEREPLWKNRRWFLETLACATFFVLDLLVWHQSIMYIGPGLATILANFQVFCLALFGVAVLGERITFRLILAIPLAVTGLFLLIGLRGRPMGREELTGICLGLAAAGFYSAFLLILRRVQSQKNPLSATANLSAVCIASAVLIGAYILLTGESFAIPDWLSFFCLLGYALFSQVIGWILITRSLPAVRTSLAGLLLLLQPTLAFTWDILFFGRQTTATNLIGAAIALTAIYIGATGRVPRPSRRTAH